MNAMKHVSRFSVLPPQLQREINGQANFFNSLGIQSPMLEDPKKTSKKVMLVPILKKKRRNMMMEKRISKMNVNSTKKKRS